MWLKRKGGEVNREVLCIMVISLSAKIEETELTLTTDFVASTSVQLKRSAVMIDIKAAKGMDMPIVLIYHFLFDTIAFQIIAIRNYLQSERYKVFFFDDYQ